MQTRLSGHGGIPKYRRRILNLGVRGYIGPGCDIVEWNIQVDHIHLIMVIPPKYAVSDVIGKTKRYTTSMMREKFVWLEEVYRKEQVVWSPGYSVSTVGLDETQMTDYVRWQCGQDSGQASLDLKSATGFARGYPLEPSAHQENAGAISPPLTAVALPPELLLYWSSPPLTTY